MKDLVSGCEVLCATDLDVSRQGHFQSIWQFALQRLFCNVRTLADQPPSRTRSGRRAMAFEGYGTRPPVPTTAGLAAASIQILEEDGHPQMADGAPYAHPVLSPYRPSWREGSGRPTPPRGSPGVSELVERQMEHLVVQPSGNPSIARGQLGRGPPIALMSLPTPTAPTSPRTTERGLASGSAPVALAANAVADHAQPFAVPPGQGGFLHRRTASTGPVQGVPPFGDRILSEALNGARCDAPLPTFGRASARRSPPRWRPDEQRMHDIACRETTRWMAGDIDVICDHYRELHYQLFLEL